MNTKRFRAKKAIIIEGPWPKKGTPLRFRAKKGHRGMKF